MNETGNCMTEKISSWTDKARIAAEGVETCSFLHVHEEKVVQVQQMMPDDQTLNRLDPYPVCPVRRGSLCL